MNVGITRIVITDKITGRGGWRFIESQKRQAAANNLYRDIFANLGTPLLAGESELKCSLEEFEAGYDYALGIDVILTLVAGDELTLQEKFLFTQYKTVTVEYMQNPTTDEQGDWFKMKAQLYFVGYDRIKALSFQDWILLNWPAVKLSSQITWQELRNRYDGARASFKYSAFDNFPDDCVIARN